MKERWENHHYAKNNNNNNDIKFFYKRNGLYIRSLVDIKTHTQKVRIVSHMTNPLPLLLSFFSLPFKLPKWFEKQKKKKKKKI